MVPQQQKYFALISRQLAATPPELANTGGYSVVVERLTPSARAYAVAAAAAHDLNNELTVILNSLQRSLAALEPGHPARPMLLDLRGAAQRCAWKASGLLNYSAGRGARPTASTLERLIQTDSTR